MAKKSAHAQATVPKDTATTTATKSTTLTPATPVTATKPAQTATTLPPRSSSLQTPALSAQASPQDIINHVWNRYLQDTPTRTMLLDVFMVFLVLVGGLQFTYCVLAGNYPFNAFLSGFCAAVGQFVLTASLRMQTTEQTPASSSSKKPVHKTIDGITGEIIDDNKPKISSERSFADFVFASLILHAFCIHFIN